MSIRGDRAAVDRAADLNEVIASRMKYRSYVIVLKSFFKNSCRDYARS